MISFEDVGDMLDEIALTIPDEILKHLNGGIMLLPEAKLHPQNKNHDLYIMGEYHRDSTMGRYITIYYTSFIIVFGNTSRENQKIELRKILFHELTHHLESLAGERGLEIQDKIYIDKYLQNKIQ